MMRTTGVLRMETSRVGLWTAVRLEGELDVAGLPALQRYIDEICAVDPHPRLVIDFSAVTFMDSCGLGGIVRAWKQVTAGEGRFVLVGVRDRVRKVLHLTQMLQVFEIYDSMEEFTEASG